MPRLSQWRSALKVPNRLICTGSKQRLQSLSITEIDRGGMRLTVRGKSHATTATEFRLLEYLARHKGRVFSRDELLDAVWRDTAFVTPRSVDVYISRLREKVESNPEDPVYLRTVRGAGYRFEVPGEK